MQQIAPAARHCQHVGQPEGLRRIGIGLASPALRWVVWERRPCGDPASLLPGRGVVDDAGETPSQLYRDRQLAAGLVSFADGGSVGFGDDIHDVSAA
jgi:hypothetical protein